MPPQAPEDKRKASLNLDLQVDLHEQAWTSTASLGAGRCSAPAKKHCSVLPKITSTTAANHEPTTKVPTIVVPGRLQVDEVVESPEPTLPRCNSQAAHQRQRVLRLSRNDINRPQNTNLLRIEHEQKKRSVTSLDNYDS